MCRDIVDGSSSLGLVVPARIEREVPQKFTVLGHHPDVQAVYEHGHPLALVRMPHADVVQARPMAEGDLSVLVDPVTADPHPGTDPDLGSAGPGLVPGVEGG